MPRRGPEYTIDVVFWTPSMSEHAETSDPFFEALADPPGPSVASSVTDAEPAVIAAGPAPFLEAVGVAAEPDSERVSASGFRSRAWTASAWRRRSRITIA